MRVTHLDIKGYKSLYDISIEMRPLMVLIGPNGAGKTSFLESIELLQAAANGSLSDEISKRGGLSNILTRGKADMLDLSFYANQYSGTRVLRYVMRLRGEPQGYHLKTEQLFDWPSDDDFSIQPRKIMSRTGNKFEEYGDSIKNEMIRISTLRGPVHESMLAAVPSGHPVVQETRALLHSMAHLIPIDVSARSPLRLPQDIAPGFYPYPNSERLFSSLYNLRIEHDGIYESILDTLRVAFPNFKKLDFPAVASGKISLYWYDKSSLRPFDQSELSDGTLRFLWLLTILLSPQKPPLLLIDEPEVSLHPEMLMLLAEVLKEASMESQIIVATHSDRLIRWLEPEHIAAMDKEEDVSSVKWLDPDKLAHWMKDYTLDQLWSMGKLEGRP